MESRTRRTKIVATLGPASREPAAIRALALAGMDVARLNFSHGTYEEHARTVAGLRRVSAELDLPTTILQDLQGPKVRVGKLLTGSVALRRGQEVFFGPEGSADETVIPLDYPFLAEEIQPGMRMLLADGVFELEVIGVEGVLVRARVIEGGLLASRKGVNLPDLDLRMPSLTDKDRQDLAFGLEQGVDWISLSFVRTAEDVLTLKRRLGEAGHDKPVIAKIERPQAVRNLEEIVAVSDGIMVARGDLGVEISPEKVPMLQKRIIELCNRRGIPAITATQMLESMIHEPVPTRAEASDVANAILDGTDAIMLSGETAVGAYPVRAVETMARIAGEVERGAEFKSYPPFERTETHALSEAANLMVKTLDFRCIAVLTTSGFTARLVAAERAGVPVAALTTSADVYHRLNLLWGVRPVLVKGAKTTFEELVCLAESTLLQRNMAGVGDRVLVLGGLPAGSARGTNFMKVHTVA